MNAGTPADDSRHRFSHFLDRQVSVEEMGNRARFADFTEADVLEFHRLLGAAGSVTTIKFMRYRINGGASLPAAVDFYQRVLLDGCSVEQWAAQCTDRVS